MSNLYIKKIAVIIPALEPDENLISLAGRLKKEGFSDIIIVNDGSSSKADPIFSAAANSFGCTVISHAVNLGKGRALKTAFNYVLTQKADCIGAVMMDADGQHKAEDAAACARALCEHPDELILGIRQFGYADVPLRSKLGNIITQRTMKFLCDIDIPDTQTGLRAMSRQAMRLFLSLPGERYEYEMNMLLEARSREIPFFKVPIETVYIDGNGSSHFNPLIDSAKVYFLLLKFILASVFSFVIDITLFTLLIYLLKTVEPNGYILISTVIARAVSASLNYLINKSKVFLTEGSYGKTAFRYILLCILLMAASAACVNWIYLVLRINETLIKMAVDMILFLMSFKIQQKWVFSKKAIVIEGAS